MTQRHRRRPLSRLAVGAVAALVTALAATGTGAGLAAPARAAGAVMLSTPKSLGGWGVTGLDLTTSPLADFKSNVTALAEWNGRIYVGGMFTTVANKGVAKASQPFLAAFDRATGAWVPGFRPTLDGGVWDLAVTPKGQLLVAGYFGRVNGAAHPALVALNPSTGAVDSTWKATLSRTTGRVGVRTMDLQGSWVYVGGNVTAVTGGTGTDVATVKGKNLFRLKVSNGRPSAAFRPTLSTSPWQVDASPAGDRVYAAGKFGTVNGVPKRILAVLSATDGSLVSGVADVRPSYETSGGAYSEAVLETADRQFVIATPTEHSLQQLGRATLDRRAAHYTGAPPGDWIAGGGDFQALAERNGVVYAACHCWKQDFTNAWTTWVPGLAPTSWSRYSKIQGIGAYDAVTFAKLDTFTPSLFGQYGDGTWQLFVDSAGCLWAGGDITRTGGGTWLGGFAKFCTT
ncbi:delta-60 repeat domain-containing protein [Kineosporia sp. R_H_3]|uniref:delta-60 repeat domain-containing protein n=1 Tax=Kineosporia sp. R_H_3 TaxID=1961848 RepID=UPI000B4B620C|nr:delta-60 repeat domain-containing protein [Kineosporia sp. R_H_3]